jgi:hypothetical protein
MFLQSHPSFNPIGFIESGVGFEATHKSIVASIIAFVELKIGSEFQ